MPNLNFAEAFELLIIVRKNTMEVKKSLLIMSDVQGTSYPPKEDKVYYQELL